MSPQATLFAFILVVCGLSPLIDASEDNIHCENLEYTGPIKEVIELKPTELAEAADAAADIAQGLATDLVSAGLEGIPFVGAALGSLFGQLVDAYGGGGLEIEDVYNSLQIEIAQLRKYMDQGIEDVKIDYVKKAFGTNRGGILSYAQHCQDTYKDDAEEMAPCLENLRAMLSQQYHFFLPEGDSPSAYEQTLPLFRMYGQLYVDTLLDQITAAKTKGKERQAVKHAEALIAKVKEFEKHAELALKVIVSHHAIPNIMPTKDNPKCFRLPQNTNIEMCVCTLSIGPAIANYWNKQLGETVAKWKKTAEALQPMVAKHKRSLPLLERIQFEREVAADIAKEKRMMQKRETAA
ncbi:hypothetical protein OS493_035375 [Desmophyllum pertusum]|uniref:Uncharacterized protein n=1 Tax=Desmophyllum pertusum TaxID=174260 RepID=A0A9W9ZVV7_9CNID|nr:hypothetical protein OS493_035375 [Desmophyllum pertusum]